MQRFVSLYFTDSQQQPQWWLSKLYIIVNLTTALSEFISLKNTAFMASVFLNWAIIPGYLIADCECEQNLPVTNSFEGGNKLSVFIMFVRSFIQYFVLQQIRSLFQSEFCTEDDLVLRLSISSTLFSP